MAIPPPSAPTGRALYLYENPGMQALAVDGRGLYLYETLAIHSLLAPTGRGLYLYESLGIQALRVLLRALYAYEAFTNDPMFPWLLKLAPTQQYPGGEVALWGDGFGDTQAADGSTVYLHGEACGVAFWSSRSPGLWPATDGVVFGPAIVFTVPPDGVSGLVIVEETVP